MMDLSAPQPKVRKILFVEDNLFFSKVLGASLLKASYQVVNAPTATDALEILKDQEFDLILSDYEMPAMNGFAFRQEVLKQTNIAEIPFVFLTSFTDNELVLEGLNMNAIDYINKETPVPVIISKLSNIIRSIETEHLRSVRELRIAAEEINVKSVATVAPDVNGFDIRFWHKGYMGYPGGDFIDFIKINDRYCFVLLGDIMGKKWKAWFFTFGFRSYIKAVIGNFVLNEDFSLLKMISRINSLVCQDDSLQNILSSLSLILIDSETGQVLYSGAGDLPLIHFDSKTKEVSTIASQGLLLGLLEDDRFYDQQIIQMNPGDKLAMFTDGLIDIPVNNGKKSDYPFFVSRIHPFLNSADSFDEVERNVLSTINESNQMDDASLIFLEKL